MTVNGRSGIIAAVGALLTLMGAALVFTFRLGQEVEHNSSMVRLLAAHVCRIEARQVPPLVNFDDCLYDITGAIDGMVADRGNRVH